MTHIPSTNSESLISAATYDSPSGVAKPNPNASREATGTCPVMGERISRALAGEPAEAIEVVESQPSPNIFKRYLLLIAGLFWVFVGAIGVILPGIPTAGPLILASICLTKSCPWLEQRLVRSRFFAAFHRYLDRDYEMPTSTRIAAICVMWTSISVSCYFLSTSQVVHISVPLTIVAAGLVGTVVIWNFRRG